MAPEQRKYDASEIAELPPFVRVPTGEVELDARGELLIDEETGRPAYKTQAFLVRRTGSALKEILALETERMVKFDRELEEESDALDKEQKARDEDRLTDAERVDLDWLGERRRVRSEMAMDTVYRSVALLLVNPATGEHPDWEKLAETLDFVVAEQWMSDFVPRPTLPVDEEAEAAADEAAKAAAGNGPVLETPTVAGSEGGQSVTS
jgi:hypothetical protein